MKRSHAFTVVELLVVIVVIGILASISLFSYNTVQQETRDNTRKGDATVIAAALEKYYDTNGEYPPVSSMINTNAVAVKQLLGLSDDSALVAPKAASGTSNSWVASLPASGDYFSYTGNTDTSAMCLTGSGATQACVDFKIQYREEKSGNIVTIYSQRKTVDIVAPPPPVTPPPNAPSAPTITLSYAGTTSTGTVAPVSCTTSGSSPLYSFRRRTDDGAWGAWTTFSATTTSAVVTSQGVKYGVQVKAVCQIDSVNSAESILSAEATYIAPISTPSTPIVTESTSGSISTWNWNTTTCPAGTTARYQYKYIADWGYTSPWYGPYAALTSRTWDTASQGYEYIVQVQTHCYTAFYTSNWSGTGQDNYIRPVSNPGPVSYSISRGASNIVYVYATSSCDPSVWLSSRADVHTWDYPWEDNGAYGWWGSTHSGVWVINNWGYNGNTVQTGSINNVTSLNSGSRWNIATEMKCKNSTTGRESASTGRLESGVMYLP